MKKPLCHKWVSILERTYEELVAEGQQKLNAVHLFSVSEGKLQLERQQVQLSILVQVLLPHLQTETRQLQENRASCHEENGNLPAGELSDLSSSQRNRGRTITAQQNIRQTRKYKHQ